MAMEKNSNRRSSTHSEYIQKLPDGGWGWVVVFAAFATNFVWGGLFNSYGVLYREFLTYFQEPRSYTSWIGSVLSGIGYASGNKFRSMCNFQMLDAKGSIRFSDNNERFYICELFSPIALRKNFFLSVSPSFEPVVSEHHDCKLLLHCS